MNYICLKCKKTKKKTLFMKMYKKQFAPGKIIKVPECCGFKMNIV